MRRGPSLLGSVVAGLVLITPLGAQVGVDLSLGAGALRARREAGGAGGSTEHATGLVLGGRAALALGRATLELRYAQGSLEPQAASGLRRELVDGRLAVGVRLRPWLVVQTGPHARTLEEAGAVDRWAWWEARARAVTDLVGPSVSGDVELWSAFGLEMDAPLGRGSGQGGEVGVVLRGLGDRVWVRLAYAVDRIHIPNASRRETLDGISVAAGLRIL